MTRRETFSGWPAGDGEMAARIRAHDWSATPLGPMEGWPQSLKTAVGIVLASGFPATLQYGRSAVLLYNDAYIPVIGDRHPRALGRSSLETFSEIRPHLEHVFGRVFSGETVILEDQHFTILQETGPKDVWFTLSHSPVRDEAGAIFGILVQGIETRAAELRESERRYWTLFDSIDQGFCVIGMIFDEAGVPRDYRFLETNAAFERQTGLANAVGQTMRTLEPRHEEYWFATFGRIALTGKPERFEHAAAPLGRYYEVYAFRVGDPSERKVGILFNDISERKRAELALREREERFRALVSATSDVAYSMSPDWREMRRLLGRDFIADTEDPSSTWFENHVHPQDQPRVLAAINAAIEAREVFDLEHQVIRVDGSLGWTHSRAIPLLDENGRVIEWIGTASDITDRKNAEERLRENEERYRAIIDQSTAGIAELDPDGRITLINDEFCKMLGRSPEEMLGRRGFYDLTAPEDQDGNEPLFAQAVRTGGAVVTEKRYLRPDGRRVWVRVSLALRHNAQGEVIGAASAAIDITERKRAEQRLRESEDRLARILAFLPVAVGLTELEGNIVVGNPMLHDFLSDRVASVDPEKARRWRSWDAQGKLLDRADYPVARALRGEETVPGLDFLHTREDGSEIWTRVTAVPFRGPDGAITGALLVVQNIDREKRDEQAQQVLIGELQHRTRNLIAVIQSLARQTLASSADLTEFRKQFDERLMALSRVQGLFSRKAGPAVALRELFDLELSALGAQLDGDRVSLSGPDIRLPGGSVQILMLAVHELCTNALKHGALGVPEGKLAIEWRKEDRDGVATLVIDWLETGVDLSRDRRSRQRRGYGRELIERALPYQLGGSATFDLRQNGLRCTIAMPIEGGLGGG